MNLWSEYPAGYVFSAHALKGEMSVSFLIEPSVNLKKKWKHLILSKQGKRIESSILHLRSHTYKGKQGWLVQTQDCQSKEQAESYKGAQVLMGPEFFDSDHYIFFWKKILKNQKDQEVGQVVSFQTHGSYLWLVIQPPSKKTNTFLVPFVKQWILDDSEKVLQMDLPEGLEDL